MFLYQPRTRRAFLKSAIGATLALPFLPSLYAKKGWAAPTTNTKRFAYFTFDFGFGFQSPNPNIAWSGNSAIFDFPTARNLAGNSLKTTSFANGATLRQIPFSSQISLSNLSSVLSPLAPFQSKTNFIEGLHCFNASNILHNFSIPICASGDVQSNINTITPTNASIDQILAASSNFYTSSPIANYINIGHNQVGTWIPGQEFNCTFGSYDKTLNRTLQYSSASNMVNTLLSGNSSSAAGSSQATMLNSVLTLGNSAANGAFLSAADKQVLTQYLDAVSTLASQSNSLITIPSACQTAGANAPQGVLTTNAYAPTQANTAIMLAQMLMCGLTQIVGYRIGPVGGEQFYPTLTKNNPGIEIHSQITHVWGTPNDSVNDPLYQDFHAVVNYWISVVSAFLKTLDVQETTDSTYLDNTIVLVSPSMGAGGIAHSHTCHQALLIGGKNFLKQQGQYLNYFIPNPSAVNKNVGIDPTQTPTGLLYNQLLNTIFNSFSIPSSEWKGSNGAFGEVGTNSFTLQPKTPLDSLPGF